MVVNLEVRHIDLITMYLKWAATMALVVASERQTHGIGPVRSVNARIRPRRPHAAVAEFCSNFQKNMVHALGLAVPATAVMQLPRIPAAVVGFCWSSLS